MRVCLFRHSREKRSQAIARLGTLPIDWQGATGWVYVRWGEVRLGCGGSAVADPPDSTIDADAERLPPTKENWVNGLRRFERRLERLVSDAFAKAFRSAVQPVEIAAALQRECDNNAQILSRQRRVVPNDFHVELSGTDLERMAGLGRSLVDDLVGQLGDHASAQGYVFPGPVTIAFDEAEDLTTGRFRILSRNRASVTDNDQRTRSRGAVATLEVNGTRHELRPPGLVIGRGTEADLRINDPGISRRHLEIEVDAEGVAAVDLGSTNGIVVDGAKVARARLHDGSTIRIGRTDLTIRIEHGRDEAGGWNV